MKKMYINPFFVSRNNKQFKTIFVLLVYNIFIRTLDGLFKYIYTTTYYQNQS